MLDDPQGQATKYVANFVHGKDKSGQLLVVYYAGHGEVGSDNRLLLTGQLAQDERESEMSIDWAEVENTLGKAKADVLVILDCCYAGVLSRAQQSTHGTRKKFQYIAACEAEQRTKSAGPDSFTTAFIWALNELANEPVFSTRQLVRTLTTCEDFQHEEEQEAFVFCGRFDQVGKDIWIAPAKGKGTEAIPEEEQKEDEDERPTANVLAGHANGSDIEATAEDSQTILQSKTSFLWHKFYGADASRRWLDVFRRESRSANDVVT